jgi:hypothetical protein
MVGLLCFEESQRYVVGVIVDLFIKMSRYHHADDNGGEEYSSYAFLTSTLYEVSGQRHAPAALYPR